MKLAQDQTQTLFDPQHVSGRYLTDLLGKQELSTAIICETFATEDLGSPVVRAERSTFPGASASFKSDARTTTNTV